MSERGDLRRGRHVVSELHVHLVFLPRYRKSIFTRKMLGTLESCFRSVCSDFGSRLVEMNGEADHVHLLVEYPPKVAVSVLVNSLKGVSSRLLRKDHPEVESAYWKGGLWSPSYYAGSVGGASIEQIRRYIEDQKIPEK